MRDNNFIVRKIPHRLSVSVSALCGLLSAAPAQLHAAALEEVTVTARKFEENLQKTPVAVAVLSGDDIKNQSVQNLAALTTLTPSLSISNGSTGGSHSPLITIRGQAQTTIALSVDAPIGMYMDGIYSVGTAGSSINHFLDIDRVEILKGPQGTLYGRNTTGGAVNIYTKKPVLGALEGEVTLGAGDYDRFEQSGVLNVPIGDTTALRIAAGNYQRDGYGRDVLQNRDVGDENTRTARAGLLLQPSEPLEILLRANWEHANDGGLVSKATYIQPGSLAHVASALDFYGPPPTPAKLADALALIEQRTRGGDFYDIYGSFPGYSDLKASGGSATISYDFGSLLLKSISSYSEMEAERNLDGAAVGARILGNFQFTQYRQITQELQATGTALDDKLKYVVGAFYYKLDGRDGSTATLLTPVIGAVSTSFADISVESPALYTQMTYALTDRLNLTGGLRQTSERKVIKPYTANPALDLDTTGHDLSYTAGLDFNVDDAMMLYAKVSRGYKSGGYNQRVTVNPATIAEYEPEIALDYEVGIKSEWFDRRVRLNADIYRTDYKDIQRSAISNVGGPPTTVTRNAAQATIDGLEIDLSVVPVERSLLRVTVGYTHPSYDEYLDFGIDQSFQQFLAVSQWSYSVSGAYTWPTALGELRGQLDWAWRSEYDTYPSEAPGTVRLVGGVPTISAGIPDKYRVQDAYGVLNAQLALSIDDWDAQVRLYGKNLADEEYLTQSVGFVNAGFGFAYAAPGDPRTFGVELTKRF